ncbi:MAG: hypothetical protein ACJASB_003689 [Shewanella psychromarinicola]|jgi:hypothetical protein
MSANLFSETGRLNYEQAGDVAKHMQEMFYEFVNEHLFHPKNINAAFHPESVRKSEKRKQMRREAKLAKRDRPFNFLTRLIEHISGLEKELDVLGWNISDSQQLFDELTRQLAIVSESCDTFTEREKLLEQQCQIKAKKYQDIYLALLDKQKTLSKKMLFEYELDERLNEKAKTETTLDISIGIKNRTNVALDTAITEKQSMLDKLSVMTAEALQPINQMLERMHKRLILNGRAGAKELMQSIMKAFTEDLPQELRNRLISVTRNTGDIELKDALTRKDSQINDSLDT